MILNNFTQEEIESMSYDDIAYEILKESNKKMKTTELFKKICECLNMSDSEYENQIAEFFQVLSTDQRFIMVNDGYWDLKTRHRADIVMEEEEDDELALDQEDDDDEIEEDYYDDEEENDDDNEDDLKDLVIISEDDQESDLI